MSKIRNRPTILIPRAEDDGEEKCVQGGYPKRNQVVERPVAQLRKLRGDERGNEPSRTWTQYTLIHTGEGEYMDTVGSLNKSHLGLAILGKTGDVSIRLRILIRRSISQKVSCIRMRRTYLYRQPRPIDNAGEDEDRERQCGRLQCVCQHLHK